MAPSLCPRCQQSLSSRTLTLGKAVACQACTSCGGVSLDTAHLAPLFQKAGLSLETLAAQAPPAEATTNALTCPRCAQKSQPRKLQRYTVGGADVDFCAVCAGTWLDAAVVRALGGVLAPAPQARTADGARVEEVGVYEMFWDCEFCDTKALLGKSNRFCPGCGAPQNPSKRYFPPEGQEVKANTDYDGADKACPACATPNGALANNCRQCGSPMDGSKQVARQADRGPGLPPGGGTPGAPGGPKGPAPKKKTPLWVWALAAVLVLSCGFCGVAVFWTKDTTATVKRHDWVRTIDVEAIKPVQDSEWCDRMPSDAYSVSRKREKRSTNKVADGETCTTRDVDRGDGTFSRKQECKTKYRDEPVYDDRCSFTVDRWKKVRTQTAKGGSLDETPRWPDAQAGPKERLGSRSEAYTVHFAGPKGEDWKCAFKEPKWRTFAPGAVLKAQAQVVFSGLDCTSL